MEKIVNLQKSFNESDKVQRETISDYKKENKVQKNTILYREKKLQEKKIRKTREIKRIKNNKQNNQIKIVPILYSI